MKLVFATNNEHKAEEIRKVLPPPISIHTLREAGIDLDIPEPHDTLEDNAREKAATIHRLTGSDCFSEDTGLEVYELNGEPGVKSARYAGEGRSSADNMQKLLEQLKNSSDRKARFRTVICLYWQGKPHYFDGICEGRIARAPAGAGGFGYDAVFLPEGSDRTFAQMTTEEKNRYSHRRKAVDKLVIFLNQIN